MYKKGDWISDIPNAISDITSWINIYTPSVFCYDEHNGLAKISVPSMLHFDEKIKFLEFCSK